MKINKVYILGTVASGKTTLAKELSKKLKIKHYDLDNIYWLKFGKKRDEKERDKLFRKLCNKDKWILEGAYYSWIDYGIKKADLVILLKLPRAVLLWRVTKRVLKKEKSKLMGEDRYKENFADYYKYLRAIIHYYDKKYTKGYYKHKELIDKYKVDFISLKNNKQIKKFMKDISK